MGVKKIVSVVVFAFLVGITSISMAEDFPIKGDKGISVDSYSRVLFKKMLSDDYALSLGILLNTEFWNEPYEDREFFFLIGLRNYREKGKNNYFIDVDLAFSHDHVESDTSSYWARDYSLRAYYGLEHFLNENLSLGGRVGILAGYTEAKQSNSHKYFRGPLSDIALTYYW